MMRVILLINILFIPVIYSGSNTTFKTSLNPEKSLNQSSTANKSHKEIPNEPKLLVSEGGSLLLDTSSLSLPKKNSIQPYLDIELGSKKDKPVVRRNGVGEENNIAVKQNSTQIKVNDLPDHNIKNTVNDAVDGKVINSDISKLQTPAIKNVNEKPLVISTAAPHDASVPKLNISKYDSSSAEPEKVTLHKKPTVLSYEALANMYASQQTNIPDIKSSSNTLVNDQMPSPNGDSNKVYPKNASRHPGMIMPVVITILVVPMFAVLGYMALRRGQEAWKNRHYKRMDFLLDGMYND